MQGPSRPTANRPTPSRTTSAKKAGLQQSDDIAEDFWKEHGLSEPKATPVNKKTHALKQTREPPKPAEEEEFDEWDNWDTPTAKQAEDATPESDESDEPSDRKSTRLNSSHWE